MKIQKLCIPEHEKENMIWVTYPVVENEWHEQPVALAELDTQLSEN